MASPKAIFRDRRFLAAAVLVALFAPAALLWEPSPPELEMRLEKIASSEDGIHTVTVVGTNLSQNSLGIQSPAPFMITSEDHLQRLAGFLRPRGFSIKPGGRCTAKAWIPHRFANDEIRIGISIHRPPSRVDHLLFWLSRKFPIASARVWFGRQIGPNAVNYYTEPFVPAELARED